MSKLIEDWLNEKFHTLREGSVKARSIPDMWLEDLLTEKASLTEQLKQLMENKTLVELDEYIKVEAQLRAQIAEQSEQVSAMREDLSDARTGWEDAVEYGREIDEQVSKLETEVGKWKSAFEWQTVNADNCRADASRMGDRALKAEEQISQMKHALEYYADPESYEERHTLTGLRGPGVLVERGKKARQALEQCIPERTQRSDGGNSQ